MMKTMEDFLKKQPDYYLTTFIVLKRILGYIKTNNKKDIIKHIENELKNVKDILNSYNCNIIENEKDKI